MTQGQGVPVGEQPGVNMCRSIDPLTDPSASLRRVIARLSAASSLSVTLSAFIGRRSSAGWHRVYRRNGRAAHSRHQRGVGWRVWLRCARCADTLVTMTPRLLVALGALVAIGGGMFNLGGEGQLQMGAIGAMCCRFSPSAILALPCCRWRSSVVRFAVRCGD